MPAMMHLLVVLAALGLALSQRVEQVMVTMRDGVKLNTIIAFPKDFDKTQNKATAIMDRSPYGAMALELINDIFVPFGFITVGQDMRGTGKSEGNFTIWHSDANDSQDLGDWLVQQPWSNGDIFTFGASADGLAAFRTPENQPSWLKAQYFIWSSSIAYDIIFPNGAYLSALADMWIRSTVPDEADDLLVVIDENEAKTEWWEPLDLTGKYYKIDYPSGFWSGWYDIFMLGNLAAYDGYNYQSSAKAAMTSRLLVDPLGHCQSAAQFFPQDLIGGRSALGLMQAFEVFGIRPVARPAVRNITFYVMSSNDAAGLAAGNFWSSVDAWPKTKEIKLYLHGDGTASTSLPGSSSAASSSFTFDPSNPVPSMGGNNLQLPCGPLDQAEIDKRSDVLTFQTAPYTEELAMTGALTATLFVSSSAIDTDFMVRLSDVYPTGEVRLLQDNGIRMRWRQGGLTPVYMTKDEVYEVTLSLWNTSYVLAPGHALRVSVTSSNSPRFDVNRNNGILLKDQKDTDVNITATNTVYHSNIHASYVTLPVVGKKQLPPLPGIMKMAKDAYPTVDWDAVAAEESSLIRRAAFPFDQPMPQRK